MRMPFASLIVVIIFFFAISCRQKCPCGRASLPIGLSSFSSDEIDTVIIKKFVKNSNFQSLQDSLLVDKTNCEYDKQGVDTVFLSVEDSSGNINASFDYEIFIPAVNRLVRLNNVSENYVDGFCGQCFDPISSYVKDGQTITSIPLVIEK